MAKLFIGKFQKGNQLEQNNYIIEGDDIQVFHQYLNGLSIGDYVLPLNERKVSKYLKYISFEKIENGFQANFEVVKIFAKPIPLLTIKNCKYFQPEINLLNQTTKASKGVGFFEMTLGDDFKIDSLDFESENIKRRFFVCTKRKLEDTSYFNKYDICVVVDNSDNTNIIDIKEFNGKDFNRSELIWQLYEKKNFENRSKFTIKQLLEVNKERALKKPFLERLIAALTTDEIFYIIDPIDMYDFILVGAKHPKKQVASPKTEPVSIENALAPNKTNFGLNSILYGPPGTGKTYKAKLYAVALCEGKSTEEIEQEMEINKQEVLKRYKHLIEDKRIGFITFHQSYGYEEFIEGIRPKTDNSHITYNVEPGVFKKFCTSDHVNFDILWSNFLVDIKNEKVEWKDVVGEKNVDNKERKLIVNNNESVIVPYGSGLILTKENARNAYLGNEVTHSGKEHFRPVYEYFKRCYLDRPRVFIIDEINRGNISKIFGELITLIEENKRGGADEEMSVKLPYSGEEFSVPQNIYILGTMNTADRSIALMDTALRRRFAFVELMPKPEIISYKEVEGLDVVKMLETINKRIEVLYDREHTIGHAYFMGKELNLNELENIFKNKIIPLLQEYFYEDYEKISLVLGDNQKDEKYRFFTNKADETPLFKGKSEYNTLNTPYKLNEEAFNHIESYIKIY